MAPPEVTTGEPLNHTIKPLKPIKFLNPSNSLILHFIKNTPLGNPTTSLVLPGLPYVTLMKFDKTPAQIPLYYYDFLDIFGEIKANTLPPYRPYVDHAINLVPGQIPPFNPLYSISQHELQTLKIYLNDILTKGFIRPSSSPTASPILFIPKNNNPAALRLCINYRKLNDITVKDKYPLPLINKTLH